MKTNPYERLKADDQAAHWWQSILGHPHYAKVIEAAKFQLEAEPTRYDGVSAIEALALVQAAQRGGSAALAMLEMLGSDAFAEARMKEEQARAAQQISPAYAGRRHASQSQPPPELTPRN